MRTGITKTCKEPQRTYRFVLLVFTRTTTTDDLYLSSSNQILNNELLVSVFIIKFEMQIPYQKHKKTGFRTNVLSYVSHFIIISCLGFSFAELQLVGAKCKPSLSSSQSKPAYFMQAVCELFLYFRSTDGR